MSWLVDVAKALTTALNDHESFSQPFGAERSYADWSIELKDLDSLRVDVVPGPVIDGELESRSYADLAVTIDVGIRKRFGRDDQDGDSGRIEITAIDELVELTQEIWLFLLQQNYRITANQTAVWKDSKIVSAFSRRDLRTRRQYTAIVRSTYTLEHTLDMA